MAGLSCSKLKPSKDDSPEVQQLKEKALERLSNKGFPDAQETLARLYLERGDNKRALLQSQRLENNPCAEGLYEKGNKLTQQARANIAEKKKSMASVLETNGGENIRGQQVSSGQGTEIPVRRLRDSVNGG